MSRFLHFLDVMAPDEPNDARHVQELINQATSGLDPFERYVRKSIDGARRRSTRAQAKFRASAGTDVNVTPLDTCILIPKPPPRIVLQGWPEGQEPDRSKQAYSMTREQTVDVLDAQLTPGGLLVTTDPELEAGETLHWNRTQCTAVREPDSPSPRDLRTDTGQELTLRGEPQDHGSAWRVVLAGRVNVSVLNVDGGDVMCRPATSFGVTVTDSGGRRFPDIQETQSMTAPPAEGPLVADDGAQFSWRSRGSGPRAGVPVQLLPVETVGEEDDLDDPREWFFEDEVTYVQSTAGRPSENQKFFIRRGGDRDQFRLFLDRLPPQDATLYLPLDLNTLVQQQRAVRQLKQAPLSHHRPLLRLLEPHDQAHWPVPAEVPVAKWQFLQDETRDGTDQQREFVRRALGSQDFILMEGPPGSGKTHAICELIYQLLLDGKRVLMCGSTHASVDNVLERILASEAPVEAVRIGRSGRVDENMEVSLLDEKVDALTQTWLDAGVLSDLEPAALRQAATRTVVACANLTCGTTMGIAAHPSLRAIAGGNSAGLSEAHLWDVLIVDEASKTRVPEFLVPAMLARRWVVVGDVRQLPPFTDRRELIENVADLRSSGNTPLLTQAEQRACLIAYQLLDENVVGSGARWLVCEPASVLDALQRELSACPSEDRVVVRVGYASTDVPEIDSVTLDQIVQGHPESLRLATADWLLVVPEDWARIEKKVPGRLSEVRRPSAESRRDPMSIRHHTWAQERRIRRVYRQRGERVTRLVDVESTVQKFLTSRTFAEEIVWRMCRIHELRDASSSRSGASLQRQVTALMPRSEGHGEAVRSGLQNIANVGLPSILEVLQRGCDPGGTDANALTRGLPEAALHSRFTGLTYQHRMHPEIAALPRDIIYKGQALMDANTISDRDKVIKWDFASDVFPSRRCWVDVEGSIDKDRVNRDEIKLTELVLKRFLSWAEQRGRPARPAPEYWEVACLAFYNKQADAMARSVARAVGTPDQRGRRFRAGDVEVVVGTVDRFQGREADLVLLSMRNTKQIGFLDSPNRLNVAMTRARQQLVVFGDRDYFLSRRDHAQLHALAERSCLVAPQDLRAP